MHHLRLGTSSIFTCLALVSLSACTPSSSTSDPQDTSNAATVDNESPDTSSGTEQSLATADATDSPADTFSTPSSATDDTDSQSEASEVFEHPYAACTDDSDCEEGLECLTVRSEPKWGQCTRRCEPGDKCPDPPDPLTQQVGCYTPGGGLCTIVCGQYDSECPEWLECISMEVCLEPTNQVPTQGPGESCSEPAQCTGESDCVQLGDNPAYCSPMCETNDDCAVPAKNGTSAGICTEIPGAGYKFCMFQCPPFAPGAYCPGDLKCTAGLCL